MHSGAGSLLGKVLGFVLQQGWQERSERRASTADLVPDCPKHPYHLPLTVLTGPLVPVSSSGHPVEFVAYETEEESTEKGEKNELREADEE